MAVSYQIKPGDTLSGIAKANSTDINTLLGLNPQITNPNLIISGQNLNLPQAPAPVNPNPINNATATGAQDTGSLSTPATGLDVNIPNIIDANQLKDAFNTGLTQNDISSYLAELKNREADVAKNLVPTDTEKALQTQLAGVTSGIEKAQSDLGARPGIDFFTLDRGKSEIQRANELTVANLQRQIGIEQTNRSQNLEASKFLLTAAQTGFDTLLKAHDSIINRATKLMDLVNTMNDQARGNFNTILTNLAGLTYDKLDSTTQATVNRLAGNLGIPLDAIKQGLQVQSDKMKNEREAQLFDQDVKKRQLAIQQAELGIKLREAGGGGGGGGTTNVTVQGANGPVQIPVDANLLAFAQQYASTGKIPTGIPKNSFGTISALAKALPKQPGTIIDVNTGTKPDINDAKLDGYSSLYDVLNKIDLAKEEFKKIIPGIVGGTLGKIFGSDAQTKYNATRIEISDLIARARTGATLNAEEQAHYSSLLPSRFNKSLFLGASGTTQIDKLKELIQKKLDSELKAQGIKIVGYGEDNSKAAQFDQP